MILRQIVRTVIKTTLLLGKQMQKKRIAFKRTVFVSMLVVVLGIALMGTAHAVFEGSDLGGVCSNMACTTGSAEVVPYSMVGCSSETTTGWGSECVKYCTKCGGDYTLIETTYFGTCTNSLKIKYCKSNFSDCELTSYSSATCGTTPVNTLSDDCAASEKKCFGNLYVKTCTRCTSGSILEFKEGTPPSTSQCKNKYSYNDCPTVLNPLGCIRDSQCTDGVGTTNITGGTKTVTGSCVDGECEYTTSVSCNANYYKSGSSCSECPDVGGVNGLSLGGTSGITSCYIPMNTKITGTNGKYVFQDADCFYSRTITPGGLPDIVLP